MDTAETDCMEEQITETFDDHVHSPGSPVTDGIHDEPRFLPRIGDEYQVVIPLLATETDCLAIKTPLDGTSNILSVDSHVGLGLDIPIMWVLHEGADSNVEQDLPNNCQEHDGSESKESINLQSKMCFSVALQQPNECNGYSPLPGSPSSSWSAEETQIFLLGLYIFGKDLIQVKGFIECKKMGDILSYYYGKFYRSDAYIRWSEHRKAKRRCILGHRIFTGRRQQEFLSRVLPKTPKDAQDIILKAAKTLNEAKDSLQEFVCTLKKIVGMQALVEIIGIGKGKHDLTGILDPVRSHQSVATCTEIPVGKACSSLTTGEIIKYLTGDFRLSKARSYDLFWEAIWPRLLDRGWHSEQPIASKNSLVFIVPGIEKFSRKKLLKGHHYFDSVTDVINKVSSDPSLLELDTEAAMQSNTVRDENQCVTDMKSLQNGLSDNQHHSFLRPRVSIGNSELMKFTIVDTSMCQGEEPVKVRELRSLPIDAFNNYNLATATGEVGSDSSEYSDDSVSEGQTHSDPDSSDKMQSKLTSKNIIGRAVHSASSKNALTLSCKTLPINGHISNDKCFVQDAESRFSCRAKSEKRSYLAPIAKRRRLTACKYEQTGNSALSFSKKHQSNQKGSQSKLGGQEEGQTAEHEESQVAEHEESQVAESDHCRGEVNFDIPTSASSDKMDNYPSKEECCSNAATVEVSSSDRVSQSRTLIDLNLLPNSTVDSENGDHMSSELASSQHYPNETAANLSETNQQHDGSGTMDNITDVNGHQLPPSHNSRRQSTRKRPPTARALESVACGFLGTKRRGKSTTGTR